MSSNVKVYGAIYSAESCSYDAGANQLVIPMNANNAMAFIPLE
jgi:hypothetical protein